MISPRADFNQKKSIITRNIHMCNIILVARVPTIHKIYVWPRMVNDVQIFIVSEGL